MKILTNDWTKDVTKSDIIDWVKEELDKIEPQDLGETQISILLYPISPNK